MILNIGKRAECRITIGDENLLGTMDIGAVDHFQKVNNTTFLGEFNKLQLKAKDDPNNVDVIILMRLAGSIFKNKKGNPVGFGFFKQYDPIDLSVKLLPIVIELVTGNLPKAANETEKN